MQPRALMQRLRSERGITGLETAIVLIGTTITEGMECTNPRALSSLEQGVRRLHVRLRSGIKPDLCWDRFVAETGSELVDRSVGTFWDTIKLGGDPDQIGYLSSLFSLKISLMRENRKLVSQTFMYLMVPLHAVLSDFDRDHERHILLGREVIRNEARALEEAAAALGHDFVEAVELIATHPGVLVTTGIGKSGQVARKIAATFAATGTPSSFLHSSEVVHGDMGALRKHDLVLAVSHSGETPEIVAMLPMLKRLDVQIIAITDNPRSTLSLVANVAIRPGNVSRADPIGSRRRPAPPPRWRSATRWHSPSPSATATRRSTSPTTPAAR